MKASKRMLAVLLSVLLLLPSVVLPLSVTAEETGTVVTRFYEGQVATHDYTGTREWNGTGWTNHNTLNIFGYVNNEGVPSPAYTVEKANLENLYLKFEIQISNPQNIEGFDATKFNGIVRLIAGGVQADYAYGWSNFVTAVDTWSEVSVSLADIFASKLADLPDSGELTQLLLFAYDNHTIGGASNSDPEGTEANPFVSATTSVRNVRVEDIPQQTVEPEPEPVDKDALKALIDEATEKVAQIDVYTPESIATLQTALTAAQTVYNDEEADQDAVDAQETALQAALTALVEIPDEPEPDPTGKDALLLLLESKLSAAALNGYTGDSRQAYNELFAAAQDVYDNEEATDEQVDKQIAALQTADEVLVPLDADTVISFWETERTSSEAHYLSLDRSLGAPVSLEGYEQGDLLLTYEIRIDATENHPDSTAEGWLSYIRNGESRLWSVDAADAKDENRVVIDNLNCSAAGNKLENIQAGTWLTVTAEVPAAIMEAGQISKFHLFIYNDLHALNSAWFSEQADKGVTMSLRNVKVVKAHPEIVNKAVLESLIAQAQEIAASGLYTQESTQALQAAITAAQAVVADDAATQDQVTAQTTVLQIAIDNLVLADLDIVWGDMNNDGLVTAADALVVLQAATGKVTLSDELKVAANVDGKGGVTSADALMVLQRATQKITSFPLEEPVEEPSEQPTEEPAEG